MALPEEVPVAFHEFDKFFSEEEWKILHEWQNELSKNVMNEIHQALISLGPLITASVLSLRAKEKQDVCPVGNRDSERIHRVNHSSRDTNSNTDVSFGKNHENKPDLVVPQDTGRWESKDCVLTGPLIATSVLSLRAKEKQDVCPVRNQDSERSHRVNHSPRDTNSNTDLSFGLSHENKPDLVVPRDMGRWESKDCVRTDHETILPIVSFIIKEEADTYDMDYQDSEDNKSLNVPARHDLLTQTFTCNTKDEGDTNSMEHQDLEKPKIIPLFTSSGRRTRKKNKGNALKCNITAPSKALLEEANMSLIQSTQTTIDLKSQLSSQVNLYWEEDRTAHCKSEFSNPTCSGLYTDIPQTEKYDTCNEIESNQKSAKLQACQQKEKLSLVWYQCTQCDKGFRQNRDLTRHIRTHTGERPYPCTKCDKSFTVISSLRRHQRTHTGERPYKCAICEQRFSQKGHLVTHQRTHTSERNKSKTVGLETMNWATEG